MTAAFDDAVEAMLPSDPRSMDRRINAEKLRRALPVIAQALRDEADRPHELGASLYSRGEQRGYRRAADLVERLGR